MVVDLQHEVHYLNNQLYLILDWEEDGPAREEEEEEDPKMFIEDDGWEEEEQWCLLMRMMLYLTSTVATLTSRVALVTSLMR